MSKLRRLPPIAALVFLLAGTRSWAEERPRFIPTRDVDIVYEVTREEQPSFRERVRWLASVRLERIDGPGTSTVIFDRKANELTLLNDASRTYSQLDGASPWPIRPEQDAALIRGAESVVAGLRCAEWSWIESDETHTACVTTDGVLLRFAVNGKTSVEARSVSYGAQAPELFQLPAGYAPAFLAPEAPRLVR